MKTITSASAERIIDRGDQLERLAYSVREAVQVTGLGRTTLYTLMDQGRLRFCKVNKRRVIRRVDLAAFIEANIRDAA